MKRRIALVTVLVIIALMLCGCEMHPKQDGDDIDVGIRTLKSYDGLYIVYDKNTGVMYWVPYHGACTPLLNADGTPRIWKGE